MRLALLLLATTLFAQAPPPVPAVTITAEERRQIEQKAAELEAAIQPLRGRIPDDLLADAEVYLKAARWILRYNEFYSKAYVAQTMTVLDTGLARARELAANNPSWTKKTGSLCRAYRSGVDGSLQPYALTIPPTYDGQSQAWLEVILHGRGATLNEVSFLYSHDRAKPAPDEGHPIIKLDVFGRANVAYRWAGETDVYEAIASVVQRYKIDPLRVSLRGFSMGGGGAWHLGLHHPDNWSVVEAGAGFVETKVHGKVENPTPYAAIYDVLNSAINATDVPFVGYGGEDDPQRRASVFIREALQKEGYNFQPDGLDFTATDLTAIFLTGPHTQHKWHPDSKKISDAFVLKYETRGIADPSSLRFATYTERYNRCFWVSIDQLERDYEKAEVDAKAGDIKTQNVARLTLRKSATSIDGQAVTGFGTFEKIGGKWRPATAPKGLAKKHGLQGPIDDAFMEPFLCVRPEGDVRTPELDSFFADFAQWMRGDIRIKTVSQVTPADEHAYNIVAFGTPANNPLVARMVKNAPIQWTAKEIVVGKRKFDAATHQLAMIYPNPENPSHYLVINSGHTFHEPDFKGTNVLLYPRVGDWAVTDLATGKLVAEGVFDRNWKLPANQ